MPYGIKNETPKQTKWMEGCVDSVMGENKSFTKSRAIAICKVQLKKSDWDPDAISELSMREELWELEKKIREAIMGPMGDDVERHLWVADVFDDYIIVEKENDLYQVDWKISGEEVTVNWDTAKKVERMTVYEPVKGESEHEIVTKVPDLKAPQYRRITNGPTTI